MTQTTDTAELDEAYEIHASNARYLHEQAREALMGALALLGEADRWLSEAAERDCGGDCCLSTADAGHADSLIGEAVRDIHAARALAHSHLERQSAPAAPARDETRLTADTVLFAEQDGRLHVLLIRRGWPPFEGCWALPGGLVDPGENVEDAAYRELTEETGIRIGPCLKPAGVYADPGRDPRGRYVTWAYAARLGRMPEPVAADDAAHAEWVPVDEALTGAVDLAFDHRQIVHDALKLTITY